MKAVSEPGAVRIRAVRPDDLDALMVLCAEHARYERAVFDVAGKIEALGRALFEAPARLAAWVAELDDVLIGYASAAPEFSTWRAAEYLHMDCLFVRDGMRGEGVGAALLDAVIEHAGRCGYRQLQWQTPAWNDGAARFYRRYGAQEQSKLRFALETIGDAQD